MATGKEGWALITGATHGIGEEIAKCAGREGYNLLVLGRDQAKLDEIVLNWSVEFRVQVIGIQKDLAQPKAAQEVYDFIKSKGITVDVLVNNAGVSVFGHFVDENPLEQELEMIQINVASFMTMTKLFLKDMVARNKGRVLHTSSMAADMPIPKQAVYSGTKAFIQAWSIALQTEIKETAVTITILYPGGTDTPIWERMGAENTVFASVLPIDDPKDVAEQGWKACMSGSSKVTAASLLNKLTHAATAIVPNAIMQPLLRGAMHEDKQEPGGKNTRD